MLTIWLAFDSAWPANNYLVRFTLEPGSYPRKLHAQRTTLWPNAVMLVRRCREDRSTGSGMNGFGIVVLDRGRMVPSDAATEGLARPARLGRNGVG
jgi:hypothetical protein